MRAADPGRRRCLLAAGVVFLAALQLGWLPILEYHWAFNLWQYLPVPVRAALALAALATCALPGRWLCPGVSSGYGRLHGLSKPGAASAIFIAVVLAFLWLVRERNLIGDWSILASAALMGMKFFAPEPGATFLFYLCIRISTLASVPNPIILQATICVFGAFAIWALVRVSGHLATKPSLRGLAVAIMLSGGLVRILAGHIEVYAFVLAAAAVYLWAACSFIAGRCHFAWPCAALGVGLWVHFAFLCLVPSLLVLPACARGTRWGIPGLRDLAIAAALAVLPTVLFAGAMILAGEGGEKGDIGRAVDAIRGILVLRDGEGGISRWVALARNAPTMGTDYALFSFAQLKYLANAGFILAPAAIPILVAFALFARRRLVSTPIARFLLAGCVPLFAYALALRPIWGPYDWDLFALTALFSAVFAAHLLAQWCESGGDEQVGWRLVLAAHVLVTIPVLWIGVSVSHPAGPFSENAFSLLQVKPGTAENRALQPWL